MPDILRVQFIPRLRNFMLSMRIQRTNIVEAVGTRVQQRNSQVSAVHLRRIIGRIQRTRER